MTALSLVDLPLQSLTTFLSHLIPQLMNVEGMTRENVASHLQKYRLYLKRIAGVSSSTPIPPMLLEKVRAATNHFQMALCASIVCRNYILNFASPPKHFKQIECRMELSDLLASKFGVPLPYFWTSSFTTFADAYFFSCPDRRFKNKPCASMLQSTHSTRICLWRSRRQCSHCSHCFPMQRLHSTCVASTLLLDTVSRQIFCTSYRPCTLCSSATLA
jgi:hypothetical protein